MKKDLQTGMSFPMDGKNFRVKRYSKCDNPMKHVNIDKENPQNNIYSYFITIECKKDGREINVIGTKNDMIELETPKYQKETGN